MRVSKLLLLSLAFTSLPLLHCSKGEEEEVGADESEIGEPPANPTIEHARTWGKECGDRLLAIGDRDAGSMERAVLGDARLDGEKAAAERRIQSAFEVCLRRYIQLPTINVAYKEGSKGEEALGAEFLKAAFERIGVPAKLLELPGRPDALPSISMVATLTPENAAAGREGRQPYDWQTAEPKPSLLLLNHIDVVDVNASQWLKNGASSLAFSGFVGEIQRRGGTKTDRAIWGRGALDMKGTAITQLVSMTLMKLARIPMEKPVHFLAVSDEEQTSTGARGAIAEIKNGGRLAALRRVEVTLNEGGSGVVDAIGRGSKVQAIATEEKGGAWLTFKHANGAKLADALARMHLVPVERLSRRPSVRAHDYFVVRGYACELAKIATPNAKVNIVPSKVEVELSCASLPPDSELEESFNPDESPEVKVAITRRANAATIVVETASASHGSTSFNTSALDLVASGIQNLRVSIGPYADGQILRLRDEYPRPSIMPYVKTPATRAMFDALGEEQTFLPLVPTDDLQSWIEKIPISSQRRLGYIAKAAGVEFLTRTTCNLTALSFERGRPAEALADCRIIDTTPVRDGEANHGARFRDKIKTFINDPELGVELLEGGGWNFTTSSATHPAFARLAAAIKNVTPDATVTPVLFPAGSDNTFVRDARDIAGSELRNVQCYGFAPMLLDQDELRTFHGSDERLPTRVILPLTKTYFFAVRSLTN